MLTPLQERRLHALPGFDDLPRYAHRLAYRIPPEQGLAEIQRVAALLGHTPTMEEFDKHASICHDSVARRFGGSWNRALAAAGLTLSNARGITRKQVIADLKHVAKKLGRTPTIEEFNTHASMSNVTLVSLFGSWNQGLMAAGLTPNRRMGTPREQFIADLKHVAKKLGRTPTIEEFGKYASAVRRHFGSWNKGLVAAGLTPNHVMGRAR